ncbi:MAG: hypothetical protein WA632_00450 [Gallionella sp.]
MPLVAASFSGAFRDLFQFKVLWIVVWPAIVTTVFWLAIGMVFWNTVSVWIVDAVLAS